MKRKKILWLCSWYPSRAYKFNGDFIQRHALAASLSDDVYVIHVCGSNDSFTDTEKDSFTSKAGLQEHILIHKSSNSFTGRLFNFIKWKRLFKKAVKKYIAENGLPDLVHVHVPFKAGLIALWLKKKYGLKYLVSEHWTVYQPQAPFNYSGRSFAFKKINKRIAVNAEFFVPVSENLGRLMNELITKKGFSVIPNTADTELFNDSGLQLPAKPFRFIHVSNLNYQKNAEAIIACFCRIYKESTDAELYMVGPFSEAFSETVKATGLLNKSIILTGEIEYKQVAEEMKKANALVMFSRFENLPCTIIEAFCCGLPVIASNVGGIAEIINNQNGVLVEPGNETQLESAMRNLMNNYSAMDREKIAEDAQGRFSYPVIGKKFNELYRSVVSSE